LLKGGGKADTGLSSPKEKEKKGRARRKSILARKKRGDSTCSLKGPSFQKSSCHRERRSVDFEKGKLLGLATVKTEKERNYCMRLGRITGFLPEKGKESLSSALSKPPTQKEKILRRS